MGDEHRGSVGDRPDDLVAAQLGRAPRGPWRVAAACDYGYPSVIASPSLLEDGSRFPTLYWLTCPYLVGEVGQEESSGAVRRWAQAVDEDPDLARRLRHVDEEVRARRAVESGGADACEDVGLAGQANPFGVKCLHAHVAYAMMGIDDPIGAVLVERFGTTCDDERCKHLGRIDESDA